MDVAMLAAFATPFMATPPMLWHQQRTILKKLSEIGERLASMEGYLRMGMPPAATEDHSRMSGEQAQVAADHFDGLVVSA